MEMEFNRSHIDRQMRPFYATIMEGTASYLLREAGSDYDLSTYIQVYKCHNETHSLGLFLSLNFYFLVVLELNSGPCTYKRCFNM
jgi:hypothetical protein